MGDGHGKIRLLQMMLPLVEWMSESMAFCNRMRISDMIPAN
jgi:hypothetical protein